MGSILRVQVTHRLARSIPASAAKHERQATGFWQKGDVPRNIFFGYIGQPEEPSI